MQYKPTRSLCATVAIAATLALGSTTSFAQEAAPVISIPAAAPVIAAPAAAPTVVVPPVTVQPTAPQPVAAAPSAPAPRARAERPAPAPKQAATTPRAAAPAPVTQAPAPSAPVAAVPVAAPAEMAPATPLNPVEPVAEATQPQAKSDSGLSLEEGGFLALLAALGIGGVYFVASGMRRHRRQAGEVEVHDYVEEPALSQGLKPPVALATTTVQARPVYDTAAHPAQPDMARPSMAQPGMTGSRDTFAMPSGAVPTGEERQELIDRMVAAQPDEANPFTSAKARRRRARIILQARESEQGADTGKPFDWRTFGSDGSERRRAPSDYELA